MTELRSVVGGAITQGTAQHQQRRKAAHNTNDGVNGVKKIVEAKAFFYFRITYI